MIWRTRMGRRVCYIWSGGEHVFTGWSRQAEYRPGRALPTAYCERCGVEL